MARFGVDGLPPDYQTNPDFRPTQVAPVIALDRDGKRDVVLMRWGLVPFWASDPKFGLKCINARAETVDTAPAFRDAFRRRRALVPAGAFYEWTGRAGAKTRHRISLASGLPMTFAGLCEHWKTPAGEALHTFTIITCAPSVQASAVHDRMPVIIDPENFDGWLTQGGKDLLVPYAGALIIEPPPPLLPLL